MKESIERSIAKQKKSKNTTEDDVDDYQKMEKYRTDFTDDDWFLLKLMGDLLKPFANMQKHFEGSKYVSISSLPTKIKGLKDEISVILGNIRYDNDYMECSEEVKECINEVEEIFTTDFDKRWGNSGFQSQHLFAEALDPLFMHNASEDTWELLSKHMLEDSMEDYKVKAEKDVDIDLTQDDDCYSDDDDLDGDDFLSQQLKKRKIDMSKLYPVATSNPSDDIKMNRLNDIKAKIKMQVDNDINQYRTYGGTVKLTKAHDVLQYHHINCHTHPAISKYSKKVYCIQPTSASSERVFSQLGLIVSDKRHMLSTDSMVTLLYLKSNFRFLKLLYNNNN